MDCERGFYVTTDGGKTWERTLAAAPTAASATSSSTRATSTSSSPSAYKLYRRAWTYIDRQPGNDLYKTTDGGKTWKKLDRAACRTGIDARPGRPGHLPRRTPTSSTPGSTRRSTSAWPSATAWPTSGPGGHGGCGGGGGCFAENKSFDTLEDLQDRSRAGQAGAQVHARRRPPTRPSW
ncbi:MAG: hypothetical protein M0C28_41880 [Candidatus Moduliflexus flocculans]|nr:hypothetical protein [Candidatus Moduliflexus flocculans]